MPGSPKTPGVVRFGIFEVEPSTGELRKAGVKVRLQDQPLQILLMLLGRPGEVVTREEIQARLWPPGTVVEFEHSIGTAIKKLRQALGDDADTPRYVETLPKRGFRFIAPVEALHSEPAPAPPPAGLNKAILGVAILGLIAAGAVAVRFGALRTRTPSPVQRALTRLTFDTGLQLGPAWSPDGRFVAYGSNRGGKFDIWVEQVGGLNAVKVTTRPGHNWQPDWSPDGSQIVFRSEGEGGGLFVVSALGGQERRISSFGYRPRWSPDGRSILFGNTFLSAVNRLYLVGLDGEPPHEILQEFLKKSLVAARAVDWYPHSNRLSIWGQTGKWKPSFWTVSTEGTGAAEYRPTSGIAEQLDNIANFERLQFRWGPSGRVLYFAGEWNGVRNIWKMTVDASNRFRTLERLSGGPGPDVDPTISADGKRLAYSARAERVRIWSFPFNSDTGRLLGNGDPVTPAGFDAWEADLSPDGKKLAYVASRSGKYELWQTELPNGSPTMLLPARELTVRPRWSPDSRHIAFNQGGATETPLILPEGGGAAEPVTSAGFEGDITDWSSDGRWVLSEQALHTQPGRTELRLLLLPLSAAPQAETKARPITSNFSQATYEGIFEPYWSPNERWIAFEAVKGGIMPGGAMNAVLCVVPISGGSWTRVTDGQSWDDKPRWSPDGKTIYYMSARTGFLNVWGIHFDPDQGRPLGQPFQVTAFNSPSLMIADELSWQSMSLSQNRLVFSMKETEGSIWMLDNVDK